MNAPLTVASHGASPQLRRARAFGIYAREQLRALGMAGLVGALAAVLAIAVLCFAYLPQQAALAELEARLATPDTTPRTTSAAASGSGDIAQLPKRGELPAIVGVMVRQAASAGVVLERGSYAYAPLRAGQATRYQLTFPIKAAYPQVRKFLDLTLAAVPMAGIDTLSIERKDIGEPLVDANITFVVVARSAP